MAANEYFIYQYKNEENKNFIEEENLFPKMIYNYYLAYFGFVVSYYLKSRALRDIFKSFLILDELQKVSKL